MAENSKIEWTDATWNPVLGCDKISPGCKGCYAIRTAWRLQHNPNPKVAKAFEGLAVIQGGQPNWTGRVNFIPERLSAPLDWKKPKRVFVNSQSDLFHDRVSDRDIAAIFGVMAATPQHTYQILTKRPDRAVKWFRWIATGDVEHAAIRGCTLAAAKVLREQFAPYAGPGARAEIAWPLPNVWLGVSVENQQYADERIPLLLQTPAAVRWISAEPLLGPVSFRWAAWDDHGPHPRRATQLPDVQRNGKVLAGSVDHLDGARMLDWVVAGGESGPGARPMHPDWARSLRDQCKAAGVPFFFKQWGEYVSPDQFSSDGWDDVEMNASGVSVYPEGHITDSWGIMSDGSERVWRVGKKTAGRKLDGVEHNEYPVLAAGERRQ